MYPLEYYYHLILVTNGASLSFTVSNGENQIPGSITIIIEDAPRPPEISIITLEISEDAEVGTIVGFVEAKDPMGGPVTLSFLWRWIFGI